MPHAKASITLTLIPAPVNNGDIKAFYSEIKSLYGSSTKPRISKFKFGTIFFTSLLGNPRPMILICTFFFSIMDLQY